MGRHVVFAWELGAGYGHVAGMRPLMEGLMARGHRVSVVARYLNTASGVLGDLQVPVYQAPYWNGRVDKLDATFTFPEILLGFGYGSVDTLEPFVHGWVTLLETLAPDLVVVDHGPTAILACRVRGMAFATYGTGFFVPPAVTPAPVFVGMPVPSGERIKRHEQQVADAINGVLRRRGGAEVDGFKGLFHPAAHFLCTFEELDHYSQRRGADYRGPRFDANLGEGFAWPKGPEKRVFAYLKEESKAFKGLLPALTGLDASVVLHVPGASDALVRHCRDRRNVRLLRAPALMRQVYDEADLVVCNAGHGVVGGGLLAGKRMLLAPDFLEQNVLTYQVTSRRLAMVAPAGGSGGDHRRALEAALLSSKLGSNAQAFRDRYRAFDQPAQVDTLVEACTGLMENSP